MNIFKQDVSDEVLEVAMDAIERFGEKNAVKELGAAILAVHGHRYRALEDVQLPESVVGAMVLGYTPVGYNDGDPCTFNTFVEGACIKLPMDVFSQNPYAFIACDWDDYALDQVPGFDEEITYCPDDGEEEGKSVVYVQFTYMLGETFKDYVRDKEGNTLRDEQGGFLFKEVKGLCFFSNEEVASIKAFSKRVEDYLDNVGESIFPNGMNGVVTPNGDFYGEEEYGDY